MVYFAGNRYRDTGEADQGLAPEVKTARCVPAP